MTEEQQQQINTRIFETIADEAELYTQKLERIRSNIRKLEGVFGDPKRCQICDDEKYAHSERYTTFDRYGKHEFIAKVEVPDFKGSGQGGMIEYIEIKNKSLLAQVYARQGERNHWKISSLEDRYIIELLEGGRIAEFLQQLAHYLTQKNIQLEWIQVLSERLRPR